MRRVAGRVSASSGRTAAWQSARFSRRQYEDRLEAGLVVLEPDLAAMQLGDGAHETEPQAVPGRAAAALEAHEAVEHGLASLGRNTGPAIRDFDTGDVAVTVSGERHDACRRVFERV